jgi:hypothetical protein
MNWTPAIAAGLIGAVSIAATAAQTRNGTQAERGTTSTPNAMVTLTGCLQRAGTGAVRPGQAVGATAYVLMNARVEQSAGGGAAAHRGDGSSGGGASTPSTGATYVLDSPTEDLSPHVGKRVEIKGTRGPSSAGGQVSAGTGQRTTPSEAVRSRSADQEPAKIEKPSQSGVASTVEAAQHVRVSSVRTTGSACTGPNR